MLWLDTAYMDTEQLPAAVAPAPIRVNICVLIVFCLTQLDVVEGCPP